MFLDYRLTGHQQPVIQIPPFKLRSSKSVQLLDSLYSKAFKSYYNDISINTGSEKLELGNLTEASKRTQTYEREIALVANGHRIRIEKIYFGWAFSKLVFWTKWPIDLKAIKGTIYFTKEEIAKVTSISVTKPVKTK